MFGKKKKNINEKIDSAFDKWAQEIDKELEEGKKRMDEDSLIAELYGGGFYDKALERLMEKNNKSAEDFILMAKCYDGLGDDLSALREYDSAVDFCRKSGDMDKFYRVLKDRFYLERGIVELYELRCRYNFELSGEILQAIWGLESLKVNSVRKWDYYNHKRFADIYQSVKDEVEAFYSGESNQLNKTTCKGAERWLTDWKHLVE